MSDEANQPRRPRAPRCSPANGRCPDCRTPLIADGIGGKPSRTYRKFLCTMCGVEIQVDIRPSESATP